MVFIVLICIWKYIDFVCLSSVQFISVPQSCPTLCDPMNRSTPGLPVHHQLPEFTQTHVHQVGDALQPSHLLCLSYSYINDNPSIKKICRKNSYRRDLSHKYKEEMSQDFHAKALHLTVMTMKLEWMELWETLFGYVLSLCNSMN